MAEQFYTILTAIGKAKIANSAALGEKVELTHLALGDGDGSYYNPTEDQTALKNEVWRGAIGTVDVDAENPNWITIQTVVPSQHGGFMIREAGVFDNEGDLIAVGKYPETYKPVAADGSIKDLIVRMILEVSNTASVVLRVDPTVILATQQQVDEAEARAKAYTDQEVGEVAQELAAHKADNFHHIPYVIATGTNSYAVNIQGITALTEGMSVKVKFTNANTGASTLNINGLGAKPIRKSNGNALSSGNIKAGQICHLVYTGSVFQLLGEGGEYGNVTPGDVIKGVTFGTEEGIKTGTLELTGNAVASDVLSGKTFYSTNPKSKITGTLELTGSASANDVLSGKTFYNTNPKSKQTGTMPNRGSPSYTITTQNGQYNMSSGYYSGGTVKAQFANLIASNIRKGVNIGGVIGTLAPLDTNWISTERSLSDSITTISITKSENSPIIIFYYASAINGRHAAGGRLYDNVGKLITGAEGYYVTSVSISVSVESNKTLCAITAKTNAEMDSGTIVVAYLK